MTEPVAIVYTSNTGYTAEYAKLLGERIGLPVYALSDMRKEKRSVIYLGWLMAGTVKGYKKAAKRFCIAAVCGVGMGQTGSQLQDVRKANSFPADLPVFTLQGGFDMTKLHGVYKFMMTVMKKTAGKALANKKERTFEEDRMLKLLTDGGSYVDEKNLAEILKWYTEAFAVPVKEADTSA
ncbi:MAG: hypothetical protein ACI39E_00960 [Acutalibacteraceae bacterium]